MNEPRSNCSRTLAGAVRLALAIGLLPVLGAQNVNLEEGLEAYWTFDEGAGDTVGDVSGHGRGAMMYETPAFADDSILWLTGGLGRFGDAIDFDGNYFLAVADYLGVGGTEPRTISLWVNTVWAPTGASAMVAWGPNVAEQRWHFKLETTNGAIRTENQGGNNYGSVPVNDGFWHHVVCVFPEGGAVIGDVRHYVDGVLDPVQNGGITNPVNTNVDPAVAPPLTLGGAPFGTGLRMTTAWIDDVRIYSRALNEAEIAALAQGQGVVTGAPPRIVPADGLVNAPFHPAAQGIQATIMAVGQATVSVGGVTMTVNGADVTAELTFSGAGSQLSLQYSGLEADRTYSVEITASDSEQRLATRTFGFTTFREDNFTIEAENYNFAGGAFIDNPVLCNTYGSSEGCYFDRVSLPGIDAFDANGFGDDTASYEDVYRFSSGGATREEEFDTMRSGDVLRSKYDGQNGQNGAIVDYDVDRLAAGDWANYTRTFPAGTYSILLRAMATSPQLVRLDRVTGAATGADQELSLMGYFAVPGNGSYTFVPLTDVSGAVELAANLDGETTIRLTAIEANANIQWNFLLFPEAEEQPPILPTIAIDFPTDGSVHPTGGDITVRASADDADGFIRQVAFYVDQQGVPTEIGRVENPPYEITWAQVPAGSYVLTAEAVDNDDLSAVSSPVSIVVDSDPPRIGGVQGSPGLDRVELLFSEALDPVSAGNTANYTIAPGLTVQAAVVDGARVTLTTTAQSNGQVYTVTARNVADAHGVVQPEDSAQFTASTVNLLYGLEFYWTFDEGGGAVARDVSGFGRDAVVYDVPAFDGKSILWTDGQFGGGVEFDTSYFLVAPSYYGISGAAPRTISMWIKTDWVVPGGANAIMGWGRNATSARWHFKLENTVNGALRTENQGGNNYASIPVNDGSWHHIVAVLPDFGEGAVVGDVNHYVDGVLDPVKSGGVTNPVNTDTDPATAPPVSIGGAPFGAELRTLSAVLDDVRLYNRALSDAEIVSLFNGNGVIEGEPVLRVGIQRNEDDTVTLSWNGNATLQTAPAVSGPWTVVAGATSPHTMVPEATAFFRLTR
ncbi:MAG: hypothetical protein H7A45_01890 [Verrucomicrobiales bacterium]|nr:hypothetical protein [Verrucomicrobiales bacterium]